MIERTAKFCVSCFGTVLFAGLLMGCNSNDARGSEAFSKYESAFNAGDLVAARKSLLDAVSARDDEPRYWEALGRIQLQLGAIGDASYAFTRAHELDRSNTDVLSTLAQLSLYAGDIGAAQQYQRELQLLAPSNPTVFLVRGYLALRRGELDSADNYANRLVSALPVDAGAKLLKARILVARGQREDAIALLEAQAKANPNDVQSLKALLLLLKREDQWAGVVTVATRLARLQPNENSAALTAIEAAFKAGNLGAATSLSSSLMGPHATPVQVGSILQLWVRYWRTQAAIRQALRLAAVAPPQLRLAYATFLNSAGRPEEAAELAGGVAKLPITPANLSSNAVFAQALAISGRAEEAKHLFDAILAREPDHVYALRSRAELAVNQQNGISAIRDAQRLVTIEPNSAEDRLLLSKAFNSAGDIRAADRSLWDAFHDIPADEQIYQALRIRLISKEGIAAAQQLDEEFNRQRDVQLAREFI